MPPLVSEISPALLWHFDQAGWNVLGYQYAPGRHVDYTPRSPDLDRLIQLLDALSAIKIPDNPGPFKRAEDRWKPYLDDPDPASVFAGLVPTHSDWTPDNVLISPDRAGLIDWASPTLGVGWTGPACWLLRLMASGDHTAHEAEQQASRLHRSPPRAHRPVRRSERPAVGRSRAVKHEYLDEEDGASRTGVVGLPPVSLITSSPWPLVHHLTQAPFRVPPDSLGEETATRYLVP